MFLLSLGLPAVFRILPSSCRDVVLREILARLREVLEWFQSQSHLIFRGSSLLVVFEGDTNSLLRLCNNNNVTEKSEKLIQNNVTVKMIDFVHVHETSDPDSNYIDGISSLIEYFVGLQEIFSTTIS